MFGAFLGETVIKNYGGDWVKDDKGWGVKITNDLTAYPFNKVTKLFKNGNEGGDSIYSFFTSIPTLMEYTIDNKNLSEEHQY